MVDLIPILRTKINSNQPTNQPRKSKIVARRIAWTAMTYKILSPQHGGALPKRSAADLTAAFTHDIEAAWARGQHVTMVTLDVQGAFDALLKNRLLHRMV
jgi:hypothetical protein